MSTNRALQVGLPEDIAQLVEMRPVEECALDAMRQAITSTPIFTLIPADVQDKAFYLVRREPGEGYWNGETRFIDEGGVVINAYAYGSDGDEKAALMAEAARVVMRNAWLNNHHTPGVGWISRLWMPEEPVRKSDFANSAGPVQSADLPAGFFRYELHLQMMVRRENRNKE